MRSPIWLRLISLVPPAIDMPRCMSTIMLLIPPAPSMNTDSSPFSSVFYLSTGFHGLHVIGGLIAFCVVIARAFASYRFGHHEATSAIVTSYYWHFVDVVWVGLFAVIYLIP